MSGCKKQGCTDPDSVTYNPDAQKYDGTCRYECQVVIWYNLDTSTKLLLDGVSTLYVDIGNASFQVETKNYWKSPPTCATPGAIKTTIDLGSNKTDYCRLTVWGYLWGYGWKNYWSDQLPLNANTCLVWRLY